MEENPDGIDAFLKTLDLSGLEEQPTDQDAIRVMLSILENRYYLNCFILGQVTENGLPGRLLQRQYTFQKASLADICERVEKGLDDQEILYHRDIPIKPGPDHIHVSYELLPHLEDPYSASLIQTVRQIVGKMYMEFNSGL